MSAMNLRGLIRQVLGDSPGLGKLEHEAVLNLQRAMRKHALGPWVKAQRGVGEKQAARLLAAIGDPYWNTLHDRPRTVSELWAYCGLHVLRDPGHMTRDVHGAAAGVAAKRRKGHRANWSNDAKMRAYLIAEKCVMQPDGSPWRDCYTAARAKYADATHAAACERCGPKGKPAEAGSPLSAGHQHARALRIVAKELLKELWREAKRITENSPATTNGTPS